MYENGPAMLRDWHSGGRALAAQSCQLDIRAGTLLSAGPLTGSSLSLGDSVKGTLAITVVPLPFERTSTLPPSCLTRSRIPRSPTPAVAPEAIFDRVSSLIPLPSSITFQFYFSMKPQQPHLRVRTFGMAMAIRQALLRNPEQTQLIVFGQSLPICCHFELRANLAALGESVDVPIQGRM